MLGSYALCAEGWNSTVTTSIDASGYSQGDNFSNKDGIHLLLAGSSSVKYVLLNSSGGVVRQTTLETVGGDFPNITGYGTSLMAVYLKGSTIKAWRSTDAGATWNDGGSDGIADITFSDSSCSGVDAVADSRGLHVAYATRPSSTGTWETYYRRYASGPNWEGYKNVTDYTSNEVGGFPTITTSTNRVHVSYNTSDHAYDPDYHPGPAKTRDYFFPTGEWEDPQLVTSDPDYSIAEMITSDGTYLHMVFVTLYGSMGDWVAEIYHTKRSIGGTSWSTPAYVTNNADRVGVAPSVDGKLHLQYRNSGIKYRYYDGSNWSSEQSITGSDPTIQNISAVSNDLYLTFKTNATSYLQYKQYDASPTKPQGVAVTAVYGDDEWHPKLTWTAAVEPDVATGGYVLLERRRKIGSGSWSSWVNIATLGGTTSEYTDLTYYTSGTGPDSLQYRVQTKDYATNLSQYSDVVSIRFDNHNQKIGTEFAAVVTEFGLGQNYPNPFNPTTVIRYRLPVPGQVQLVVFDMTGREVCLLVNERKEAGLHEVKFDGSSLASGVYFTRFIVMDELGRRQFSTVNKLLLTK